MNAIFTHFSETVDDYDTVADKVVMKDDELHNYLVNSISFDSNKELNILDLGCGTGHGMLLMLEKFPNSKITGIDFSNKMILASKEKLKDFSDRIKLLEKDFNEIEFNEKYDAIVSAIAIHNSSHEQKIRLFKKIFDSLNENGIFINADFIQGESSELEIQYKNIYKTFLKKNLSGDELKVWLRHAFEEDMPMKLSEQFKILREIGFKEIELIWQFNNEVIYKIKKN
jgi:tRNA (cmo5U34)-methyltransferase